MARLCQATKFTALYPFTYKYRCKYIALDKERDTQIQGKEQIQI